MTMTEWTWSDEDRRALAGKTITDVEMRRERGEDELLALTLDDGRVLEVRGDWDVFANAGVLEIWWRADA